jgi:hypothetical protein
MASRAALQQEMPITSPGGGRAQVAHDLVLVVHTVNDNRVLQSVGFL